MKIGIIGAGFVGREAAQIFTAAGHQVMLSNSRGPNTLDGVLSDIPGALAGTVSDAAQFGDIVLVAIALKHYQSLPAAQLAGKTVLDAMNYYPERDGKIAVLDQFKTSTSRLVAEHLSGSSVVKLFNAILAIDLLQDARPKGSPDRRALPIAADDAVAKAQMITLLDHIGFDAVDAGNLDESWRFERAKPAYCIPLAKEELQRALIAADRQTGVPEGSWRR